jgi:hypothetical protein
LIFIYLGGAPFVGTEVFGLSPEQLGLNFGAPTLGYFAETLFQAAIQNALWSMQW